MVDIFHQYRYNIASAKQIRLRGAGRIRLRVILLVIGVVLMKTPAKKYVLGEDLK